METLFHRAADLTAEERSAFLDRECGEDSALRAEVYSLLASHDNPIADFLKTRAPEAAIAGTPLVSGDVVADKYRLLHELGEGGLGVVWLAEQRPPVRRKVAIKFIRAGMSTTTVLARFESERNALTLMNHPGIARVLDAGASDGGQPFFVMEYVQGLPITRFCDGERLTIRQRLELFVEVCSAVQHAHQKGVIHRDLKPSNVLVMLHDGRPVPKVIDFGIAKATDHDLADRTLVTMPGQLLGTPEYMSPEQAEMSAIGVDSTTDIYSLGVVLYELLTGSLPFDSETLRQHGLAEMHRVMREVDPPLPSTRVSTVGSDTDTISERRRTDPRTLRSRLASDLDWIVMKALEKERTRRYASASELGADIERHLRDEPVLASPPSRLYRLRKFVRRNRAGVFLGALAVIALLAGIVGTTLAMLDARREREIANSARKEAEDDKRSEAAVRRLLERGIGLAISDGTAEQLTVKDMLELTEDQIATLFPGQVLEQAAAHTTLGTIYALLDDPRGKPQLERAKHLIEDEFGPHHVDLLEPLGGLYYLSVGGARRSLSKQYTAIVARSFATSGGQLASDLAALGQLVHGDDRPAESDARDAITRVTAAGRAHSTTANELRRLAHALHLLSWELRDRQGMPLVALPLFRYVLGIDPATTSWSHQRTRNWAAWGVLLIVLDHPTADLAIEQPERLARELLASLESYPEHNAQRYTMTLNAAEVLSRSGNHDEAITAAIENCERGITILESRKDWPWTFFNASWAARGPGYLMDACRRDGREAEAVDRIGRWLEAIRLDSTGNLQATSAWQVVRRPGWGGLLHPEIYRLALEIAEPAVESQPEKPVLARLAAATARLRLAAPEGNRKELRRAVTALETIVADWRTDGKRVGWDRFGVHAVAPLAMAQFHLGDTAAARATLALVRSDKARGAMFDEAAELVDTAGR